MNKLQLLHKYLQPQILLFLLIFPLLSLPIICIVPNEQTLTYISALDVLSGPLDTLPKETPAIRSLLVWMLLAATAALGGLLGSICSHQRKKEFGFLFSLAGLISLLMLQVAGVASQLRFTPVYWVALGVFALNGSLSYLSKPVPAKWLSDKTGININIITAPAKITSKSEK